MSIAICALRGAGVALTTRFSFGRFVRIAQKMIVVTNAAAE
jgi:hypothetical protein